MPNPHQLPKSKLELFKQKVYIIIYGVNTPAGKIFDVGLLIMILLSVFTIMLETVEGVDQVFHKELSILEWVFTFLFSLEYALRIFVSKKPLKYIFSFYGIIDLLSILPMFFSIFFSGSQVLSGLRILRLLRLFRVFRLMEFMEESSKLKVALLASRAKIMVFLYTVMIIAILIGTVIYYIEGPNNGFTSIPKSVFYTIVTLTTVGYGDMVPITPLGQFLSMLLMVTGYGIIAVPTGIVGVEIVKQAKSARKLTDEHNRLNGIVCAHCNREGHRDHAEYCYNCGHSLNI
jgi:voltage-gated potassium channel